jgi:hypothetical protein
VVSVRVTASKVRRAQSCPPPPPLSSGGRDLGIHDANGDGRGRGWRGDIRVAA